MKLNSNQKKNISFALEVMGSPQPPIANVIFEGKNGVNLSFPCQVVERTAKCSLPKFKNFMEVLGTDRLNAYLEVVVEGTYHKVWQDTVYIETPVAVNVTEQIEDSVENNIVVSETTIAVEDNSDMVEKLNEGCAKPKKKKTVEEVNIKQSKILETNPIHKRIVTTLSDSDRKELSKFNPFKE